MDPKVVLAFLSRYKNGAVKPGSPTDESGAAVDQKDWGLTNSSVTSFGLDFAGEMYMMSGNSILKLNQGS